MKKRNYLILILSVIFLLTSCGTSTAITSVTAHTSTIPTSSNITNSYDYTGTPDYITSIRFDSIQEAKEFVENYDLSKYSEQDKKNIEKALDAFYADGYLIYMESSIADEKQSVSIYPQYGDISPAISYSRIYTENNSYQFRVYCAETEFLENAKETNKDDWELEYYIKRYDLIP